MAMLTLKNPRNYNLICRRCSIRMKFKSYLYEWMWCSLLTMRHWNKTGQLTNVISARISTLLRRRRRCRHSIVVAIVIDVVADSPKYLIWAVRYSLIAMHMQQSRIHANQMVSSILPSHSSDNPQNGHRSSNWWTKQTLHGKQLTIPKNHPRSPALYFEFIRFSNSRMMRKYKGWRSVAVVSVKTSMIALNFVCQ